jgi:pectate lyase
MSKYRLKLDGVCALIVATLGVAAAPPVLARQETAPLVAGSTTKGGLVEGSKVIHVTTLDDSGPGSLREAVGVSGPRVIVFDVGGAIRLVSDLKLQKPFLTIAGQTAPTPGISLWGASLRVRTHDVVIQHIAVRAGPGDTPKINDNRDAISIDGNRSSPLDRQSFEVRLENVSASWSVDEALSTWYETTHNITIRHSIVSEALNNAGHPKGPHSMGVLIGTNVGLVEVTGNLMASNMYRNPVMGKGASAYVANNYIVNPGQNAIHFYETESPEATRATVVNNAIEAGLDTKPSLNAILLPAPPAGVAPDVVYVDDNSTELSAKGTSLAVATGQEVAEAVPIESGSWRLLPTDAVKADVLKYAGTRPADRDPTDRRLLSQIATNSERLVDAPPETVSGIESTARVAKVPDDAVPVDPGGVSRLETWLCAEHFAVGGALSKDCPAEP